MHSTEDTIAALATAPGAAGLAVVRVSGRDALAIADRTFRGSLRLAAAPTHSLHHGWAVMPDVVAAASGRIAAPPGPDGHSPAVLAAARSRVTEESRIDEVVAAVFRAPRSYTREDVVEISCHGGRVPAARVLEALLAAGARAAGPGEFTLRAFLHGRIDLAQAEAVADLIAAESRAAHDLALSQLAGVLSRRLEGIAEELRDALAEVEARVDFAEDVGGIEVPPHVVAAIAASHQALEGLLSGSVYARAVREGVRVPIVGRPNAGKSSLFNALLGEERAIVTAVPGTTRDRVSEALELGGIRVTLSDTAGLREGAGPVESIGIARSREAIDRAAVVLWVVDASTSLDAADRAIASALPDRVLVALNKADRPAVVTPAAIHALRSPASAPAWSAVPVSALRGEGLSALRRALLALLGGDRAGGDPGAASGNARHVEALGRARAALARAAEVAAGPGEIVAIELREALAAIGEVTGEGVGEDLLDRIFGRFCVGK